jgi:electron transport complex protein RnfE
MQENKKLSIILKGIVKENPVLVLVLGTCPTLAVTTNMISAFSMGISAMLVLICSNMAISALRKVIPDKVRIPCFIVIIAAFVTLVQMLLQAYLPNIYDMLGVYLALIVVNCIILGRAEMFASKNSVIDSALDGVGMGLGFTAALMAMALIREVIGNGSIAGIAIPGLENFKISLLTMSPGGFLTFGILMAIMTKITGKEKKLDCAGCPAASMCGKTSEECKGGTADV